MKLVLKITTSAEARKISQRLENKGIPSKVIGYEENKSEEHIPEGHEVWIYINSQYHDAIKVIRNPSHKVKKAVNIGEFKNSLLSEQEALQLLFWGFVKYSIIISVAIGGIVYLIENSIE